MCVCVYFLILPFSYFFSLPPPFSRARTNEYKLSIRARAESNSLPIPPVNSPRYPVRLCCFRLFCFSLVHALLYGLYTMYIYIFIHVMFLAVCTHTVWTARWPCRHKTNDTNRMPITYVYTILQRFSLRTTQCVQKSPTDCNSDSLNGSPELFFHVHQASKDVSS